MYDFLPLSFKIKLMRDFHYADFLKAFKTTFDIKIDRTDPIGKKTTFNFKFLGGLFKNSSMKLLQ